MIDEILQEFLIESRDSLEQLDRELVALESDPRDQKRLGSIFRTVHSIKGTAGFFTLHKLEGVSHAGENLLSKLRDGVIVLEQVRTTALLAMVDVIRALFDKIESTGAEGDGSYERLIEALTLVCKDEGLGQARTLLGMSAALVDTIIVPDQLSEPPVVATSLPAPTASSIATVQVSERAPETEPKASDERSQQQSDTRIRVDVRLLDKLMNLVGELVLTRNQLLSHSSASVDGGLVNSCQRLNLITSELQEGVMKTRMQPIDNVWSRFPRVVRDLANSCGKQVKLEMDGKSTELDKTIIESISDPMTHLVRNSIDHGIEAPDVRVAAGKPAQGTIKLRAFHEGGRVNIEISDDGKGMDPEKLKAKAVERGLITQERARTMAAHEAFALVFLPGFSTAEQVTNISGRGVGMDVVKSNIERLGGTVDIESKIGRGSTVRIRIPLTLAIIPALIVGQSGERFAIPQVNLLELVRFEAEQAQQAIERLHGVPVFRLRGNLLPIVELGEVLDFAADGIARDANIVVVQADRCQFGLLVDGIYDTEEIVVKPLGRELKSINVYAGATIMGDGKVALILDVTGLADRAGVLGAIERRMAQSGVHERAQAVGGNVEQLLLFRTGARGRMAIALKDVARLEEFARDRVERVGNEEVVQYRGEILPLVHVADVFGEPRAESPMLQVVVHNSQRGSLGIVIDGIEDVVEDVFDTTRRGGRNGVSGSTVIRGRVTELLDPDALRTLAGMP